MRQDRLKGPVADFVVLAQTRMRAISVRIATATPREKLLLALMGFGILAYAPVAAFDYRSQQEEMYVDAVMDQAAVRLENAAARRVRATAADLSAIEDMRDWGFAAANPAIAQVLIERRLLEAAGKAGLQRTRITVSPEVTEEGPTTWMAADVEADLLWRGVFAFFDDMAVWPEGFQVTGFDYDLRPAPAGLSAGLAGVAGLSPGTVRISLAFPVNVADLSEEDTELPRQTQPDRPSSPSAQSGPFG